MRIILPSFLIFLLTNSCLAASVSKLEQEKLLAVHNTLRAQHHSPKLIWDAELAVYAENHANHCVFKHSSSPYGENLAAGYPSINAAINAWYAESELYSYSYPKFSSSTGHFTQLVWKASTKLGCAYVPCNGKNGTPGCYLVCEYSPVGNVMRRDFFEANVLPKG